VPKGEQHSSTLALVRSPTFISLIQDKEWNTFGNGIDKKVNLRTRTEKMKGIWD
jgi:hypothetical protein